jgi:hypothetical protein
MLKSLVFALGLSALTGSSLLMSAPAVARDDMAMKMDCSKAGSMMADAAKMGSSTMMSGDTDKDFMAVAMEREKGTNMLMHVEAACGTDPKMKAMAAKAAVDSDERMALFRKQSTSQ